MKPVSGWTLEFDTEARRPRWASAKVVFFSQPHDVSFAHSLEYLDTVTLTECQLVQHSTSRGLVWSTSQSEIVSHLARLANENI